MKVQKLKAMCYNYVNADCPVFDERKQPITTQSVEVDLNRQERSARTTVIHIEYSWALSTKKNKFQGILALNTIQ